jgi:hypothetical protein
MEIDRALALIFHRGRWLALSCAGPRFRQGFYRSGMTVLRLAGQVAGVPRAPRFSFLGRRDGSGLVRGLAGARRHAATLPRSGDGLRPWPGGLDLQAAPPSAAGQPSGGVQHPGRSVLGSALAKSPCRASAAGLCCNAADTRSAPVADGAH